MSWNGPYRGLMPYTEEDAEWFFGRDAECDLVLANLQSARLTLLYGTSGAGKSSLLRAGVVTALQQELEENRRETGAPEFAFVYFRSWSGHVRPRLVQSIARATAAANGRPCDLDTSSLLEACRVATRRIGGRLLLVLDQFEEYFLYHPAANELDAQLSSVIGAGDLHVNLLISMREDSLAKLDRFKGRVPNLFENYLRIRHLDRASARVAILKPVEHYRALHPECRAAPAPELVEQVLDAVAIDRVDLDGGRAGVSRVTAQVEAPYLQLVMTRLWQDMLARRSQLISAQDLQRLGGAEQIVRTHFERVVAVLNEEERRLAVCVFHYLVTPSGSKFAYSVRDLASLTEEDPDAIQALLTALTDPDRRVLRVAEGSLSSESAPRYEIFHDVLGRAILHWRRNYLAELDHDQRQREALAQQRQRAVQMVRRVAYAVFLLLVTVLVVIAWSSRNAARAANALASEAHAARRKAEDQERAALHLVEDANRKQSLLVAEAQRACPSNGHGDKKAELERLRAELSSAQTRAETALRKARDAQQKAYRLSVEAAARTGDGVSKY